MTASLDLSGASGPEPQPSRAADAAATGAEPGAVVGSLIEALARRDYEALSMLFAADVRFRALVPSGLREFDTAEDAMEWIRGWSESAAWFDLTDSGVREFAGRQRFWYRFAFDDDGEPVAVSQEGYAEVASGKVSDLALVCSGVVPTGETHGQDLVD
jgi:hypothetical protein